MKNHLRNLFITLLIPVLLTSCSKGGDDDPAPKTKTELITQAAWKFDNAKAGGFDVSGFFAACEKDNIATLAANGSGTYAEGATKCDPGDPDSTPFSWNFADSETKLHVSIVLFPGGSSDFTIVTLNETQLVISQDVTFGGSTQNGVFTFKH